MPHDHLPALLDPFDDRAGAKPQLAPDLRGNRYLPLAGELGVCDGHVSRLPR